MGEASKFVKLVEDCQAIVVLKFSLQLVSISTLQIGLCDFRFMILVSRFL